MFPRRRVLHTAAGLSIDSVLYRFIPYIRGRSKQHAQLSGDIQSLRFTANGDAGFAGNWVLNKEASEPPAPEARESEEGRPPPPNDMMFGGAESKGRHGSLGPHAPPPDQSAETRHNESPDRHPGPPGPMRSMTIAQTDDSITVDDGRRIREIFTDGRTETISLPNGNTHEITAGWDGDRLVIRGSAGEGPSKSERWGINESRQLEIAVESDGPAATLVYDRSQ